MSPQQVLPVLIPVVILGIVALRASRPRKVRLEMLWIAPLLITLMIGLGVVFTPHRAPFTPVDYAVFIAAVAVGAGIGWMRAKTVRLAVDPATHEVTSSVSVVGLLIIAAVFVVRFGLRQAAGIEARSLHMDPAVIEDGLLLLAGGLVVAQRVEIFVRARRMIAAAQPVGAAA